MGTAIMSGITSYDWILYGMQFYEMIGTFECKPNSESVWKSCTREEVCLLQEIPAENIDFVEFRPNTTNPMYLENWVGKL